MHADPIVLIDEFRLNVARAQQVFQLDHESLRLKQIQIPKVWHFFRCAIDWLIGSEISICYLKVDVLKFKFQSKRSKNWFLLSSVTALPHMRVKLAAEFEISRSIWYKNPDHIMCHVDGSSRLLYGRCVVELTKNVSFLIWCVYRVRVRVEWQTPWDSMRQYESCELNAFPAFHKVKESLFLHCTWMMKVNIVNYIISNVCHT